MKNTLTVFALLNLITTLGHCQYEVVHFMNHSVVKGVIKVKLSKNNSIRTLNVNDFLGLNSNKFHFKTFKALAFFSNFILLQKTISKSQQLHKIVGLKLFSQKLYQVTRGAPFINTMV